MFGVKQLIAGGHDASGLRRQFMIVAGDLAGALFWLMVYPTDFVKNVIQVDNYKNPKFSGSLDAFKRILATEGVKGLYNKDSVRQKRPSKCSLLSGLRGHKIKLLGMID
ncbi:hypothetical protein IFM89_001154 [Coptis chinensis]|uniref:Uncharacterized protein n=1 Tax=Coptis chinensis TaxID=261450 RepID=A0A835MC80_9MAGN|nr:hypothetical protein IFM89_001154 [Coptis chinensis]